MRIFVNGDQHDLEADTLAAVLSALGYGDRRIATAVNGRFVPQAARAMTRLASDDQVEVVAPMQGG